MTKDEFYIHVYRVAQKPGIFMINNVEELNLYFLGYCHAMKDDFDVFSDFDFYVNRKHGIKGEKVSWFRLIRLRSGSDLHSLELFRFWFSGFCAENAISI